MARLPIPLPEGDKRAQPAVTRRSDPSRRTASWRLCKLGRAQKPEPTCSCTNGPDPTSFIPIRRSETKAVSHLLISAQIQCDITAQDTGCTAQDTGHTGLSPWHRRLTTSNTSLLPETGALNIYKWRETAPPPSREDRLAQRGFSF